MNKNKNLIESLDIVIAQCFKRYSKYIIQDRALPDIRDGLKPVQRRILYAMNELGLTYDKQYKKSARTVGEVIGKYHPHGDSSIYEAMVRMSQDWKNNIPLLDMHGNNGSIDGDSAAAMRYTETKLSKVANLMLENIKKETVNFAWNFDDTEKEPTVLPSLLPNLLINGAMGIAAGYATNIPTHNPSEVFKSIIYRISNPKCTLDEIMQILPAPDFPTGGIIQGIDGVKESFKTGKGKFIISSKYHFNESNNKFNQIVITEIPYDTNKSQIIKDLLEIMYNEKVSGILDIRDESDKNGVSIVIDIKKDKDLVQIMNYFLKNSQLQVNYTTNFVAIVNRKPILVPLLFALDCYIKFGIEIILKTAIFDLAKTEKRAEIVQGLIKAIDIIDEIIKIIRKSESKEDAKNNLIAKFEFTPIQAEAIVTLRLYRLTKTDINDLKFEYEELCNQIKFLKSLIDSETLQKKYLKKELEGFDKEFGYPRKTQIESEIKKIDFNEQAIIESKDVYVFVSNDGYLKQISKKAFESNTLNEIGLKPFDNIVYFNIANTKQNLVLILKSGKAIFLPIHKIKNIKWKDIGQHINEIATVESNDKIIFASVFDQVPPDLELILLTKSGLVKKINLIETLNIKQLKPNLIIKLKDDDEIVDCNLINKNENYFISTLTKNGYGMTFSTAEISLKNRTSTAIPAFKMQKNDECINLAISKTLQPILLLNTKDEFKKISLEELVIKKRNQVMTKILKTNNDIKSFVILNQNSNENVFIFDNGKIDFMNVNEIELNNSKTIFSKSKKFTNMSCIRIDSLQHEQIVENLQKSKYKIYIPDENESENISLDELVDNNENN